MKVVKNSCYGGFSLSPAAVKRMAEINGRACYFFKYNLSADEDAKKYTLVSADPNSATDWGVTAFDILNPNEVLLPTKWWGAMTTEERVAANALYGQHVLDNRPKDRTDPILVQVVEELGEAANGSCAQLEIVDIPDGIQWEIDEYDGVETIREAHRSW